MIALAATSCLGKQVVLSLHSYSKRSPCLSSGLQKTWYHSHKSCASNSKYTAATGTSFCLETCKELHVRLTLRTCLSVCWIALPDFVVKASTSGTLAFQWFPCSDLWAAGVDIVCHGAFSGACRLCAGLAVASGFACCAPCWHCLGPVARKTRLAASSPPALAVQHARS